MSPFRALVAALTFAVCLAPPGTVAGPGPQPMPTPRLIDRLGTGMWPAQRAVRSGEYSKVQAAFRADVAAYLKGRFKVAGSRMFLLVPSDGIVLLGGSPQFQGSTSAAFQRIGSTPAIDEPSYVRSVSDHENPKTEGNAVLALGVTTAGKKVYTAIGIYQIPGSKDELMGYFQLDPQVAEPVKDL